MGRLSPINFKKWIDENRHLLKPPVGNRQIWENREFMVTVVGGPNSRQDYHINEGEEFFYQVEGDIVLRVLEVGKPTDIPICEGEIFLLPPKVPTLLNVQQAQWGWCSKENACLMRKMAFVGFVKMFEPSL